MEDDIPIAPSLYSLSNKMDNSLLAVRDINHKHIVVEMEDIKMLNSIYLLTGAAGFLGSNISRVLLEKGKKVRALVLNGDPAVKYVPEGVEIVYGDLTDKGTLEAFFKVDSMDSA